ncbi:RING finger protein 32-like [Hydractinia symbiolongicarpus]|uniref:RING finger protein 32-like n=1 Tax=Hydractinia symbiolongicarpus TaxID=13093 RepID=UPI00254B3DBB|nr:RING finger protein 32-like [Hydractinia symbiolongicarpus]
MQDPLNKSPLCIRKMATARSKQSKSNRNLTLTAVALQDHLAKTLNLKYGLSLSKGISNQNTVNLKSKNIVFKKDTKNLNKEFVIKSASQNVARNVTLAEKLGIVECEENPCLNEEQWAILKKKSNSRGDSSQPCAICKDNYNQFRQQILLSCSHVFHRQCIASFEKYSGKAICPICRRTNYEKRVIFDGSIITLNRSATVIQKHWRRYIIQKRYIQLREKIPPSDKKLRRKYYEQKFLKLSDKLVESYDYHYEDVSHFIDSIDQNLVSSKSVMKRFTERDMLENEWENIQIKAIKRGKKECPICLSLLNDGSKGTMLLSCTHVYHMQCLLAYEQYNNKHEKLCPVCRTEYNKRSF